MVKPVGFWINDYTYRMYDERTHQTRMVHVMPLDGGVSEAEEAQDVVEEYIERFEDDLKKIPTHVNMARDQQREFGPHLRSIEETNRRFREVGHGRYW